MFRSNLTKILDAVGSNVHVILINGVDIDVYDWIGEDRIQRNREMNAVVDSVVSMYPNVDLLDMRKIVTSRKVLVQHDNRHFDRLTYHAMAKEISTLCGGEVNVKNYFILEARRFAGRIKRKVKKILSRLIGK